ncbi:hypothetical protein [Winogradskyella aurantia]|uniref:C-type lysozyme inhibitor domain-containing protein n=1 Tax=Winogradskyella aurantia TaxID=1915063 RepID=A0A265UTH5_9FLAO|nr:hypothetical protein [Winogradskyella aurantia]OZV68608.1 hypothetical protein CA834_09055 [Winogradskyella aurantia]
MKNLLKFIPFIVFAIVLKACTAENSILLNNEADQLSQSNPPCVDDDPITRVINNGTISFSLDVIRIDGTVVVSIPNIPPNTTTSWASFEEGEYIFSLESLASSVSDDKVQLLMNQCMAFEIEVDINNQIVSYTPTTL